MTHPFNPLEDADARLPAGDDVTTANTFPHHLASHVEPHALLLTVPPDAQQLFKIMRVGDLIRSVAGKYLHFQRVDTYNDSPNSDGHDGEQLPLDRTVNSGVTFEKAPEFTAAKYYDGCRSRTFACCFSLENSELIWERYGLDDPIGKVCVAFNFGKLRSRLNRTIDRSQGQSALLVGSNVCQQLFDINYGIIEYINKATMQRNGQTLLNPIKYSYLKDEVLFQGEKELRITLSTLGIGNFALANGDIIKFPASASFEFDFASAIADGTVVRLLCPNKTVGDHLASVLLQFKLLATLVGFA